MKIFGKDRLVPLFVLLAVISLAATILLIRYMVLRDQWRTLNVEWHGYSIEYPALWGTQTYAAMGGRGANLEYLSASIDSFGLSALIHQRIAEKPELTDAVEWGKGIVLGWEASQISSLIETKIGYGKYPAMMQSYYRGNERIKTFYVVSENRMYMIEFHRADEDSQPMVDRMLASFKLLEVDGD